jgi:hypothetical protein
MILKSDRNKFLGLFYMTCSKNLMGGKSRKQRGGGGATGYVGCMTNGMNQVAAAGRGNELAYQPLDSCVTCKTGGNRRKSNRRKSRSGKRGGTILGDIAVPAALVFANTLYKPKKALKNVTKNRRRFTRSNK